MTKPYTTIFFRDGSAEQAHFRKSCIERFIVALAAFQYCPDRFGRTLFGKKATHLIAQLLLLV